MPPYKIMIVEDDPLIRSQLQTLLNGNGYVTLTPDPLADIADAVKDRQPHLLLLDIRLPGESGFSLCSKIRTFSGLPIIFVTSCNTDMDELNSILLGGDAFITKPYNTAILLAKINALLKRHYACGQEDSLTWQGAGKQPAGIPGQTGGADEKRTEDPRLPFPARRQNLFPQRPDRSSLGQPALCGRQCLKRQYQPDPREAVRHRP